MDSELQADVVFLFVLFYFVNFFYKLQIKYSFFSQACSWDALQKKSVLEPKLYHSHVIKKWMNTIFFHRKSHVSFANNLSPQLIYLWVCIILISTLLSINVELGYNTYKFFFTKNIVPKLLNFLEVNISSILPFILQT